ncbi:myosin heavy chain, muscle-like, partial [Penaeus japonicus]|uniref:myosin heavy chain, muscle-like n=1 Tax=Penaeus japonicus TaxID=27405 RepID=UPI001C715A8B
DVSERLRQEEDARNQIFQSKRKTEQDLSILQKEIEDLKLALQKAEQETARKDHLIRNMNDEMAHQDELIGKVNNEKKHLQECNHKNSEDLQSLEDKYNHLSNVKTKLERTLDEFEDSFEREKKLRIDTEKSRKKVEGDLKLAHEAITDTERCNKDLQQTILRKDQENATIANKLENEQGFVSKILRQTNDLQYRIAELEDEVEHERLARVKAEKSRGQLSREMEELSERLDEAGGATAAQIELNRRREAEVVALRRELEEASIRHEARLTTLRKKHSEAVREMSDQIDHLNKMKVRTEKDKEAMRREAEDAKSAMDGLLLEKDSMLDLQTCEQCRPTPRTDEVSNVTSSAQDDLFHTLVSAKECFQVSLISSGITREAVVLHHSRNEIRVDLLLRELLYFLLEEDHIQNEKQLERTSLIGKFRNLEHDIDGLREQLQEEHEAKGNIMRQLSKANAESQEWRSKYETEGVARAEELEATCLKLTARLKEAESQLEQLNANNANLEKSKQRLTTELEDVQILIESTKAETSVAEKKQKNFDRIISEWKMKVDDLSADLEASQKESRDYSSELFRIKAAYEETLEQLDAVRRENKNLGDEIKDLMDQIGEGGRFFHEAQTNAKRLEMEKEELQAALEEAEAALEQEENKVLREQLELSQVRQEIDRRVNEKEEEFEHTRKNHQRALESMKASLEAEVKSKAEVLRIKKRLESDISELEVSIDHSNKAYSDLQTQVKKLQGETREMQTRIEEEQRQASEYREESCISERRANALNSDLEEARSLLERAERGRRQAEGELADTREQLNELTLSNSSLAVSKRKVESEMQNMQANLDEMLNETKNSEEKAKKAMVDAARLADELRAEQEHAQAQEKMRKDLEVSIKDLKTRLEETETNNAKTNKKVVSKLESRIHELEGQLDDGARRHADAQKNLRKCERRIKELTFQSEEDKKNHERMQDLVDKLQQKIKTYKRQIEEAEEIAALNLAKFRKAQQELEELQACA